MFKRRKLVLCLIDIVSFALTISMLLVLLNSPYDSVPSFGAMCCYLLFAIIPIVLSRYIFGVYNRVWRYAKYSEYLRVILSDFFGGCVFLALNLFLFRYIGIRALAVSHCFSTIAIASLLTIALRYFYQFLRYSKHDSDENEPENHKINIAIVGAGRVGCALVDELRANPGSHYNPYCFIDTNKEKIGNYVNGVEVIPSGEDIVKKIKSLPIQEIVIAIGSATAEERSVLFDLYKQTGCKVKIYDFTSNEKSGKRFLREININDLLFRDSIKLDKSQYHDFYSGKTVLVTGGSGSIGSELCEQLAGVDIKQLIILDIYENTTYTLYQEMRRKFPNLDIKVEIASVRDRKKIDTVFAYYKPDIVFHAAAHKHVPLMEHSAAEAIKNNVVGTYNVADAAEKYGVEKFILISTDKAVNPTNIMGASKRVCEMIVQSRKDSKTKFAAVRFGNVLGSNGSVIPLFKQQVAAGGPVTITDKRIIRYFMTISEAVSLVMHTCVMANNGELFVLDMGKPVKILKLAEDMIKLSGYVPYTDIDIVETGLRPGEKLYEELLCKNEELDKTSREKIFIERDKPFTREEVDEKIRLLTEAVNSSADNIETFGSIRDAMRIAVPTYHDPDIVNAAASGSEEVKISQ